MRSLLGGEYGGWDWARLGRHGRHIHIIFQIGWSHDGRALLFWLVLISRLIGLLRRKI